MHHLAMKISCKKGILALIFALSLFAFASCRPETAHREAPPRPVVSFSVSQRDMSSVRIQSAPVVAYKRVYTNARTGGQVLELLAEEGDQVRRGQRLLRIDTRRQEAQLRQAEAAAWELRRQYERNAHLLKSEAISQADLEFIARQLEEAESQVEFWKVEVEFGEVRAELDGVITARFVEVGTTVAANERVFTTEDHNLLVVRPGLTEMDVSGLKKGDKVSLQYDVLGDEEFPGRIRRIFPAADPLTRLFTVEVEINQQAVPQKIRPGYLSRIRFVTDSMRGVLAIPPEAIYQNQGKELAFVISDNMLIEVRELITGIRRDGWVEVLQGLSEGEEVAAANLGALREGMPVQKTGVFRRYGFRD